MREAPRTYQRWVRFAFRSPRSAAGLLAILAIPAVLLTVQFFGRIDSQFLNLLPQDSPVVRSFRTIASRMSGKSSFIVIAQSEDADVNRRFITELGKSLAEHPLPGIRSIRADVSAEREWGFRRVPLLIPPEDFEQLAGKAEAAAQEARRRANPFLIQFDDAAPTTDWESIRTLIKDKTVQYDRFPTGHLETPDGHTVVAVIWLQGDEIDYPAAARLMDDVRHQVDVLRSSYPASLQVAYNGVVVDTVEEHRAILADLSITSIVVLLLVGAVVILYFRSARALLAVGLAVVPGLLVTFAVGRLTVGGLNSNTAFLGSIIAGNGINYPLLLLAYFRRQPGDLDDVEAYLQASRQGFKGTLGAAVTASAAYGGLALSSFRGFSQFGWLGGIGMMTVWAMTFVTLPVTVALFRPARVGDRETAGPRLLGALFARPRLAAALASLSVFLVLIGTALGVKAGYQGGLYERDFRSLRNRDSLEHGGASWDAKMNEVFGVWLSPIVALSTDDAQTEPLAQRLRDALMKGEQPLAERVDTMESFVPPLARQEPRLARLKRLSRLYAAGRSQIPADIRDVLDRWFSPEALTPISRAEVPQSLRDGFEENSGATDRVVLVYPSLKVNYNDAANLTRFADRVGSVDLPRGAVVGGGFLFLAELLGMVRSQGPNVIAMVALLASLSLLPVLGRRPLQVVAVVATSSVVALASQSIMLALGTRLNLLNFAAIAITIGVGSDYIVNLLAARDALATDLRGAAVKMGGAILLCSATTVIGYFSLVLAQSGALRSFGWSAILGELVACLVVVLLVPAAAGLRTPSSTQVASEGAAGDPVA